MYKYKFIEHKSTKQKWWKYHTSKLYSKYTTWQIAEQQRNNTLFDRKYTYQKLGETAPMKKDRTEIPEH